MHTGKTFFNTTASDFKTSEINDDFCWKEVLSLKGVIKVEKILYLEVSNFDA